MEDMEAGLREAGVGDTVVPKRLQKMSRVFLGRAHAWREAGQDSELLTQALDRNLLPMGAMSETGAILSAYILNELKSLKNLDAVSLKAGVRVFDGDPVFDRAN